MKNGNGRSLTTSPKISALTKKSPAALSIIERYRDHDNLLEVFNPENQVKYTLDVRRAYKGMAPALCGVKEAFGGGTARSWLFIQISNLMEFAGVKKKLSVKKREELIEIIMSEYGYLKLTELMDFFRKFKCGHYGKFYGVVDPMVITCALGEFMRERATILSRLHQEDREESKWRDPDYIKQRRAMEREREIRIFYSRNFYSPDFSFEEFKELWWLFNMGHERTDNGYINN